MGLYLCTKIKNIPIVLSAKIVITAASAGIFSAASVSAIDSFFAIVVRKKNIASFREIIKQCLISGFTYGLLLGVIFYGFNYAESKPIQMIVIYSALLIVSTILSNSLVFGYSKLFSKKPDSEVAGDN
ncbi:hypothetical protein Riv7116_1922 [Rivularia sp. PCC 7116]|nr:hypothetical protein Riv7116_1922 [Rivularia sp. PCC 7116]